MCGMSNSPAGDILVANGLLFVSALQKYALCADVLSSFFHDHRGVIRDLLWFL